MEFNAKKDENYVDGRDKWTVHYMINEDTKVNPGDYSEVTQIIKNGERVGQKTWRKDKNGKEKSQPYEEGIQQVPSTAKKVGK